MKQYVVKVSSVFSNIIEVEAEDEDGARQKAKEYLENMNNSEVENPEKLRHYYESTFPPENWPVITQDKYEKLKAEVAAMAEGNKIAEDHSPN